MLHRTLFSLSVDDEIRWLITQANPKGLHTDDEVLLQHTSVSKLRSKKNINIEQFLRDELIEISTNHPHYFEQCAGLGVSTAGVVDREQKRLVHGGRLNWQSNNPNCLVDFKRLFKDFFREQLIDKHFLIHNDASAKCLAEYFQTPHEERTASVFYITLSEGVNCGIIKDTFSLETQRHPEVGHIRPQLHPADRSFVKANSGCKFHATCFEGIASGARIRKSWGGKNARRDFSISELPSDHEAWDIISFYIAQLCVSGSLLLAPDLILIGGVQACDELVARIRRQFTKLNNGYLSYPAMKPVDKFIRRAVIVRNEDVFGALQLAWLAAFPQVWRRPREVQI